MDLKKIQTSLHLLNSFITKNNKNILDPMSCLITLSLLSFYEKDCKLSIHNNYIYIQRPYISQGILRWYGNDKRNDICQLCHPIEKALEWYDIKEYDILEILKESVRGLEKLQKCYIENCKEDISIIHSILYYQDIIKKKINMEVININNTNNSDDRISIFKDIWSKEDLHCVTIFLKKCKEDENNEYYLNSITCLLKGKNKIKDKIINKIIDL